ncbi:deSI-like protein At4g17486 isoform X2 [Silene latifolia]|uniref:deSI-like protein At4g17486 isoform X2 n=1 Tax=Silene latifolia TaxID=37657 RepID=UPI003D779368
MGNEEMKMESSRDKNGGLIETQVVLNVYDLTPLNNYTYWFGFGIFHSGIEVHGMEYGFGAHDFSSSGVFQVAPRSCPCFIYRSSITLGRTSMSQSEFRTFIEGVASEYHGDTYHLITKNCNHFSDDMAHRLMGKRIPGWVNRLAKAGSVCSCLLPESLQVTTVEQLPEYHDCIDESEASSTDSHHEHTETEDDDRDKVLLLSPKTGSADVSFIKEVECK